nr:sigma-70 family RNA polymerase sigma factor [Rubrobacter taiwanensis]
MVRRHQTAVYRVCYRVLGDREDARDAAQEAFIRAYGKIDTFQGRSAFRTWMLRLAVNVSLNERSRRRPLPPELLEADSGSGPEEAAVAADEVARLHRALRSLKPNHRAAVVLRDLEGLTYEEVAEALEVPPGTAKGWVSRGRRRLRELLL